MILKNEVKWNSDYEYDGFLYYAQRVTEMLDYNTEEIFSAPLNNTTTLIDEYLEICNGYVKQYHLDEVYQELVFLFVNDIVIQYKWGEQKKQQIIQNLKEDKDRKKVIMYLQHALSNYLEWCKEYLSLILFESRQDKKIERTIECFIPELFRYGYSREGIYHRTKELINIDSNFEEAFSNYLNAFDVKVKDYTVYIGIANELMEYKDILQERLNIETTSDDNSKLLKLPPNYSVIKTNTIKAIDVSVAAEKGFNRMNLFASYYSFIGDYSENLLFNKVLVVSAEEKRIVNANKDKFFSSDYRKRSSMGEMSIATLDGLTMNAKCAIKELNRIIFYHNNAISNNRYENGFLNLWSVLEFICVNENSGSKIEQVKTKVVPILKMDFYTAFFNELTESIEQVLDEPTVKKYMNQILDDDTNMHKFANLLLNPKYKDIFDSFIDEFINYPVLRTRMLHLHDDNKKISDLNKNLLLYEKRVTWQICRFYRIRNAIVHSGRGRNNLKEYGELLHKYVDQIALEIILKLITGNLCTINNVLIDTKFKYDKYMDKLQESKAIDEESIDYIVSPPVLWSEN